MIFRITINYLEKSLNKLIKVPLNSKIKITKEKDIYFINLKGDINTLLFKFKENEVNIKNSFSIERISYNNR